MSGYPISTPVIEVDPAEPRAYRNRTISWLRMGRADRVILDFVTTLDLEPPEYDHPLIPGDAYLGGRSIGIAGHPP